MRFTLECEDRAVGREREVADGASAGERTTVALPGPVDLPRTTAPHGHGPFDPAYRVTPDGAVWRTSRQPGGPATVRLVQTAADLVEATAWGPGAADLLVAAPGLVGALDDTTGFDPPPGPVREAWRRTSALRLTRSGQVLEALVPAVLEQRVVTKSAWAAWEWLLRRYGESAPGPAPDGMRVPPSADVWAGVPVWDFHRAGVDPARARTVVGCARLAAQLERMVTLEPAEALRRMTAVPGVGPWTAAHVAQRAWGDPDEVTLGDFHLPGQVGWALAGHAVDDDGMLELLEPYRGHRQRVVRHLLAAGGWRVPRRGPRATEADYRRF